MIVPEMSVMPLQHSGVVTHRPPAPSTAAAGQSRAVVDTPPNPVFAADVVTDGRDEVEGDVGVWSTTR